MSDHSKVSTIQEIDVTVSESDEGNLIQEIGGIDFEFVNNKKIRLTADIKRMFGCKHCEWKNNKDFCMFYRKEKPQVGICPKRAKFLGSIVSGVERKDGKPIGIKDMITQITDFYGTAQYMTDWYKYQQAQTMFDELEERLDVVSSDPGSTEEEIKKLKSELRTKKTQLKELRSNWFMLFDKLKTYDESYRKRTTTKKVEVTGPKVNFNDLGDVIKSAQAKVVEVEVIDETRDSKTKD